MVAGAKKTRTGCATSRRAVFISNFDRINAMVRNPQYLRDLQHATTENGEKIFSRARRDALKRKYGLVAGILVDRQFVESHSREQLESNIFFEEDLAVRVLTPWKRKTLEIEPLEIAEPDGKIHVVNDYRDDLKPLLRKGRYLSIEIDLTKRKDILPSVKKIVSDYAKYAIKPSKSGSIDNQWKVWDKVHVERKNLSQVARELYNVQGSSGNGFPAAFHRRVSNAYDKALAMINAVTPEED